MSDTIVEVIGMDVRELKGKFEILICENSQGSLLIVWNKEQKELTSIITKHVNLWVNRKLICSIKQGNITDVEIIKTTELYTDLHVFVR